ncbi:MAG: hypothetical protein JKY37_14020, partial [Nannocystaceae bacterium]|nr:hypothetical protein [Nannocystaceae bacterium]
MGYLVLLGCPREQPVDTKPAGTTDATAAAEPDPGFRARAHKAALDRFVAAGQRALVLADPISASGLGAGALGPSPLSRSARAPIRKATDAALQELDGIDRQALSAEDGMQRDLIATALHAIARELDLRPIIRRDPTAFTRHGDRMLSAVELRLATNRCEECGRALRALGREFSRGLGQLGACSVASLAAARTDLQALDLRLAALQGTAADGGAVGEAREGLARLSTRLQQIEVELPSAAAVSWSTPISGATAPSDVRRLPDRLGMSELTRRLNDEEAWLKKPEALAAELTKLLARLTAMRARLSVPTDTTTASPVTVARCRESW